MKEIRFHEIQDCLQSTTLNPAQTRQSQSCHIIRGQHVMPERFAERGDTSMARLCGPAVCILPDCLAE